VLESIRSLPLLPSLGVIWRFGQEIGERAREGIARTKRQRLTRPL
jgi:hypothetical protein